MDDTNHRTLKPSLKVKTSQLMPYLMSNTSISNDSVAYSNYSTQVYNNAYLRAVQTQHTFFML